VSVVSAHADAVRPHLHTLLHLTNGASEAHNEERGQCPGEHLQSPTSDSQSIAGAIAGCVAISVDRYQRSTDVEADRDFFERRALDGWFPGYWVGLSESAMCPENDAEDN
jgi:hypothetical protein